jgi:hypothetical protein
MEVEAMSKPARQKKIYSGRHIHDVERATVEVPPLVTVRQPDGSHYDLRPRASQQLFNHSPDGFAWGYGGSGPAQLALAILLDYYLDPALALRLHQDFKWATVARWPMSGEWQITGEEIERICLPLLYAKRVGGA